MLVVTQEDVQIKLFTMKSKEFLLPLDTKVKVVATHKATGQQFENIITLKEWREFKRNNLYNYLAYQI